MPTVSGEEEHLVVTGVITARVSSPSKYKGKTTCKILTFLQQ